MRRNYPSPTLVARLITFRNGKECRSGIQFLQDRLQMRPVFLTDGQNVSERSNTPVGAKTTPIHRDLMGNEGRLIDFIPSAQYAMTTHLSEKR